MKERNAQWSDRFDVRLKEMPRLPTRAEPLVGRPSASRGGHSTRTTVDIYRPRYIDNLGSRSINSHHPRVAPAQSPGYGYGGRQTVDGDEGR